MKKTAFFSAFLFLLCMILPACKQTTPEKASEGLLAGDDFSLQTSLSYTLFNKGEREMFSSYESTLNVCKGAEHIARTVAYYGLPMEEEYTYAQGIYYYKGFDETKISAALSEDDYAVRRADLMFLSLCDPALYKNQTQTENALAFDGATEQMEQYLKKCLGIGADTAFSSLEISGTTENGEKAEVAVKGEYRFLGQNKSFEAKFTAQRQTRQAKEPITAPSDADAYWRVTDLTDAMSINAAYTKLSRETDFSLQDDAVFSLSYAGVSLQVSDAHTYRQQVLGDAFTFHDAIRREVRQGEAEKILNHTADYQDGILEAAYDGAVYQHDAVDASDMIMDSRSYYNAAAPVGEYLADIAKEQGQSSTLYTYVYAESLIDEVFSQYITSLYDNMEGYLTKATEKQYTQRSGTLSIDENGTLLQQTLSFDVSYEIDGHTLHCTLTRTITKD